VSLYRPWKKSKYVPYAKYPANRKIKPSKDDLVCAHRTLPFGTVLVLTRVTKRKQKAYCIVLDRGPYGACQISGDRNYKSPQCPKGYKYLVANKGLPLDAYFRGILDATPAVHKMMQSTGWVKANVSVVVGVKRKRRPLKVSSK